LITAAILVFTGLAVTGHAETTETENTGSKIIIEGVGTIYGDWSCEGNAVVETTPGEALAPVPGYPGGVQSTVVTVTVQNIDCGDGTMDKHMRKALKEKDHPTIQFKTDKYALNENGDVVKAVGELTIAGFTKNVELDASLVNDSVAEGFHVEGKVDILMKEYEVKPPSLLFGILKVANEVSIKYSADIAPPEDSEQISASLEDQ